MGKIQKNNSPNFTFRNRVNVYHCSITCRKSEYGDKEQKGTIQILKNLVNLAKFKSIISKPKTSLILKKDFKKPLEISTKASTSKEPTKKEFRSEKNGRKNSKLVIYFGGKNDSADKLPHITTSNSSYKDKYKQSYHYRGKAHSITSGKSIV